MTALLVIFVVMLAANQIMIWRAIKELRLKDIIPLPDDPLYNDLFMVIEKKVKGTENEH